MVDVPGVPTNPVKEETSYLHHMRMMRKIDWEHEPTSISLFIQANMKCVTNCSVVISDLKRFLESFNLRINEGKYENEDFIILVGTDSFNLEISSKFKSMETPPILSITPRKQGFISTMDVNNYKTYIPQILRGHCWILPRYRILIKHYVGDKFEEYCVLNDMIINRDPHGGSLCINCDSNNFSFSKLIGDGVLIATPTGSTAYNKGAGGALVHPLLPVILMTPICALSLSARPIILPENAILTIYLDQESNDDSQTAFLSFDGIKHCRLHVGEKLVISMSPYPYNSIMINKSISEWPTRLAQLMGWNQRVPQKDLPSKAPSKL